MNKQSILQHGRLLYLILLSFITVNLNARPQNDAGITLELEKVTLKKALEAIEEQSVYLFFNKGVDFSQQISISVKNETIENTCKALFTPIGVLYRIDGTQIYISKAKEITVGGIVRDASGQPVPGAAVMEKGTANGTMTDLDGRFSLTLSGGGSAMEINCLGYQTLTVQVGHPHRIRHRIAGGDRSP